MKAIKILISLFFIFSILVGCEKAKEIVENAKEVTTQVSAKAVQVAQNAKEVTSQKIDDATAKISEVVTNTIQLEIGKLGTMLYNVLSPFFPWLFIIFFLLLFSSFKYIIPFSSLLVVQLPLIAVSYLISIWFFTKVGLAWFAFKGTIFIAAPVLITCVLIFFFRNTLKPKLVELNNRLISKFSGAIA